MSQSDSKDHNMMKWMGIAMVACCALPIGVSFFLGGGLGGVVRSFYPAAC
jgi:hypothetical protein